MNILITGGLGYFGRALEHKLISDGHRITILDWDRRAPYDGPSEVVYRDVREIDPADAADAEAIIHLAGIIGHKACDSVPELALSVNVTGASIIAALAKTRDVPLIYMSTGAVYGAGDGVFVDETTAPDPKSVYAASKLAAEPHVLQAGGTVIRLNHLNGVSPRMTWAQFVNMSAQVTSEGRRLSIYDPDTWRPATHIADASEAVSLVLDKPIAGTFDVVGSNHLKRHVGTLAKEHGGRVGFSALGVDKNDYKVDGGKFRAEFSWEPKHTIDTGFADAYDVARG